MNRIFLTPFALLVGLVTSNCASSGGVKPYVAVRRAVVERPSVLLEAVHQSALDQRWEIVSVDPEEGLLEAIEPLPAAGDTPMRHRWWFQVADGELRVSMRLEALFNPSHPDRWTTSKVVCRGYEYLREEAQLVRVLDTVPTAVATLAASAQPLVRGQRRAR